MQHFVYQAVPILFGFPHDGVLVKPPGLYSLNTDIDFHLFVPESGVQFFSRNTGAAICYAATPKVPRSAPTARVKCRFAISAQYSIEEHRVENIEPLFQIVGVLWISGVPSPLYLNCAKPSSVRLVNSSGLSLLKWSIIAEEISSALYESGFI
jgi:hypothetical protein